MWRGMLTHAKGDLTSAEGHYDEMARVGKDQANFAESYAFALLIIRRDQQRLPELLDLPATWWCPRGSSELSSPRLRWSSWLPATRPQPSVWSPRSASTPTDRRFGPRDPGCRSRRASLSNRWRPSRNAGSRAIHHLRSSIQTVDSDVGRLRTGHNRTAEPEPIIDPGQEFWIHTVLLGWDTMEAWDRREPWQGRQRSSSPVRLS
jgi:hypothetical protein